MRLQLELDMIDGRCAHVYSVESAWMDVCQWLFDRKTTRCLAAEVRVRFHLNDR